MANQFVPPHSSILSECSQEVTDEEMTSKQVEDIITQMHDVAYGEQKDTSKSVMVGLAAVQIGITKRIILVDIAADGHGKVGNGKIFINPEITFYSKEVSEWYEGCYSTSYVCGIVTRSNRVKVKSQTKDGQVTEQEYEGYIARIFQHEIDHLNGKVFVDHISRDEDLHHVEKEEFPLYRNNEGWRSWPKKVTREEWNKIKGY
ncbi:hypothetical protein BH09PAT1_BH09PAT1_1950 [soil metagenome]